MKGLKSVTSYNKVARWYFGKDKTRTVSVSAAGTRDLCELNDIGHRVCIQRMYRTGHWVDEDKTYYVTLRIIIRILHDRKARGLFRTFFFVRGKIFRTAKLYKMT